MFSREGWDDARIAETCKGLDIVRVPFGVDTTIGLRLEVEDGCADPVLLANRLFTLAVKVPDGLGEQLGDIRVLLLQCVPYSVA